MVLVAGNDNETRHQAIRSWFSTFVQIFTRSFPFCNPSCSSTGIIPSKKLTTTLQNDERHLSNETSLSKIILIKHVSLDREGDEKDNKTSCCFSSLSHSLPLFRSIIHKFTHSVAFLDRSFIEYSMSIDFLAPDSSRKRHA